MQEGAPIIIKKKKVSGHGHHGGAWKVAYADFMTAMFAFFLVMWIMGMSQETRAVVQGYFNDPFGFMKDTPKTQVRIQPEGGLPYQKRAGDDGHRDSQFKAEVQEFQKLESEMKDAIEKEFAGGAAGVGELAKDVLMEVNSEGLQISFVERTGEVFFLLGSDQVQPQARRLILKVAPILARSHRPMFIDGHTDARPYVGRNGYDNTLLSNDRAMAVYRLLRAGGVAEDQVRATRGFGPKRLRDPNDPFHFSNRRVTILLPFRQTLEQVYGTPKDAMTEDIEGAFRMPTAIAPERPAIAPERS